MNKHNKISKTIATTLLAGMLTAGIASAQSSPTFQINRPLSTSTQFPAGNLVRPVVIDRQGGDRAWPVAVAAVAAVVSAAVEVVHRVTESWMPGPLLTNARAPLARLGAYDR